MTVYGVEDNDLEEIVHVDDDTRQLVEGARELQGGGCWSPYGIVSGGSIAR